MQNRPLFTLLMSLLLLITACSLPLSPQAGAPPNLVAANTAQVDLAQGVASGTPPGLPVTGGTGTPAVAQVRVTSPTNCRTGPNVAYGIVFLANPGTSFPVVGRYTPGNYWIIDNPAGGTCWLWGQFAVASGNLGNVPELTVPPAPASPTATLASAATGASPVVTPTATAVSTATIEPTVSTQAPPPLPPAPTNLRQSRSCTSGTRGTTPIWFEDITLTWRDTSGESGYRIYQNGTAITSLAQNSNSYQIELRYEQGTSGPLADSFGVEAYNSGGASPRVAVDVARCP